MQRVMNPNKPLDVRSHGFGVGGGGDSFRLHETNRLSFCLGKPLNLSQQSCEA